MPYYNIRSLQTLRTLIPKPHIQRFATFKLVKRKSEFRTPVFAYYKGLYWTKKIWNLKFWVLLWERDATIYHMKMLYLFLPNALNQSKIRTALKTQNSTKTHSARQHIRNLSLVFRPATAFSNPLFNPCRNRGCFTLWSSNLNTEWYNIFTCSQKKEIFFHVWLCTLKRNHTSTKQI